NNGTHVSLGSRLLSRALTDPGSGFGPAEEKCLGDLVIKIVEHFLPLFVGTYSAAPYRLDFADFHPERVLGFLPHELDYTHLRMLWRRWKKKASLQVFGRALTPFGPRRLDQAFAKIFGLRGDLVPDFRLIDYLVALLSTDESPGLDGRPGNLERLKRDLTDLGVFDFRMAAYLPYRLREHRTIGFSGFEGRHYSVFLEFSGDLGRAVDLQHLITALAVRYVARGLVNHPGIPDDPTVESERRQPLFAAALGLPTFFVAAETPNVFLRRVLVGTERVRASRRQTGYLRVRTEAYRRALLEQLRQDGGGVVEALELESALTDLALRLLYPEEAGVAVRLLHAILRKAGARTPLAIGARDFNAAAEAYYREELRVAQLGEAVDLVTADLRALEQVGGQDERMRAALRAVAGDERGEDYLARRREDLVAEHLPVPELRRLIFLLLLSVEADARESEAQPDASEQRLVGEPAPVR
ncbi:MAG TPA: hypothetical protein VMG58_16585, partial [Candidatus Sulfotelmatobacter sp.]|nr:hypothetical protein [Candidatus Sulfotelmatobacter sp.]